MHTLLLTAKTQMSNFGARSGTVGSVGPTSRSHAHVKLSGGTSKKKHVPGQCGGWSSRLVYMPFRLGAIWWTFWPYQTSFPCKFGGTGQAKWMDGLQCSCSSVRHFCLLSHLLSVVCSHHLLAVYKAPRTTIAADRVSMHLFFANASDQENNLSLVIHHSACNSLC